MIDRTADVEKSVHTHVDNDRSPVADNDHHWQVGDLGLLKGHQVLLVEADKLIWVSQNGDCGYWPANEIKFVHRTELIYQYIHWKETIVDYFTGRFKAYFII